MKTLPPGSAKAFGVFEEIASIVAGRRRPDASCKRWESFASAAAPLGDAQRLPSNISRTLPFSRIAETFFPRDRHEWREPVGGEGNPEPDQADD